MASAQNAFACAAIALAYFFVVGLPFARRLLPAPAWAFAPMLGWALYSAITFPLMCLAGMTTAVTVLAALFALIASLGMLATGGRRDPGAGTSPDVRVIPALVAAALLAAIVAASVLPKGAPDAIALSGPAFDHAKVAMIDEMVRLGVPATNPFFGAFGGFDRLPYYYLWHFTAAQIVLLLGVSGWEADAGLTAFTAFGTLCAMMGVALAWSRRVLAAYWVVAFACTASLRPIFDWLFTAEAMAHIVREQTGFGGWLFQSAWAPQHVASASCAILAVLLIAAMARRPGALAAFALGAVVAAGYESSAWIGGVVTPLAAAACGLVLIARLPPVDRRGMVVWCAVAVALAGALCGVMLRDQYVATALRAAGSPLSIAHYQVFDDAVPLRRLLDLPAYWLVQLPLEFPAFYVAGCLGLWAALSAHRGNEKGATANETTVLTALTAVSLVGGWLLISTIGVNNDLGWRAILPGVMALMAFGAAWLADASRSRRALAAAFVAMALGLPHGLGVLRGDLVPNPPDFEPGFWQSPDLWAAVRRHAAPDERVANNPMLFPKATPWAINISWALISDRRSCYAGRELAMPFVPLSNDARETIDALFVRVFAGNAEPGDVNALAARFGCTVVAVTAWDGAWDKDPFRTSSDYTLVEEAPRWRIYRAALAEPVKSR